VLLLRAVRKAHGELPDRNRWRAGVRAGANSLISVTLCDRRQIHDLGAILQDWLGQPDVMRMQEEHEGKRGRVRSDAFRVPPLPALRVCPLTSFRVVDGDSAFRS
jgi:hypothetical protein